MINRKKIVIIGATSAMAIHCARIWAEREPVTLILVARDASRLSALVVDLQIRNPATEIHTTEADFNSPSAISSLIDNITQEAPIDIALIAHGFLPDQRTCQQDLTYAKDALEINGVSPALFAEAIADHMQKTGRGTLAIIGSVAGDRGRKSNYIYGAAKSLLERCAQGLQHRFAATGIKVVLIKPGPTDTPMTAHLKAQGMRLAAVSDSAAGIVNAIDQSSPVAYLPKKWRYIMLIIRHLPRPVFNRLNI